MLRSKARTLFAKTEVTYGTVVAPVAADAIRTANLSITPFNATVIERNLDGPTFGNSGKVHAGPYVKIEFDVEAVGSGTAGTAPKYGHLFKACGMSETIVASTSAEYEPATNGTDSLTMYFELDGQRHATRGARGTWSLKFDSMGIPYFHFVFTGLWIDPVTTAALSPTWTGWQTPKPVSFAHTPTVTLHSLASVFTSASFDFGNDVQYFNNPGEEFVGITDRKCSGSVTLLAPTLSTKNYFTSALADTQAGFTLVHGMSAGSIFTLSGTKVQLLQPNYADDKGRAMIQTNLDFCRDVADDEVSLLFT